MPTKGRDLVIPDVSLPEFLWGSFIGRGDDVAIPRTMRTKGRDLVIPDVSVPEFLWGQFIGRGDDIAIVDCTKNGESITYREIRDQSRNCAAFLHQNGAKPNDSIAICSRSPVEFIVAMFGVMECGAFMAPCNPALNKGEILQLFTINEPKMVFVDESSVETMKCVQAELPCLEKIFVIGKSDEFTTLGTIITSHGDMDFLRNFRINPSEDIAALAYSSGTTGFSKCVMVTHKNLVATSLITAHDYNWCQGGVGYLDRPMENIIGLGTVLVMLTAGMKVIVSNDLQVNRMLEIIEEYKVAHVMTVTSNIVEIANTERLKKYNTSSMLDICFGGAVTAPDVVRRLARKLNVIMLSGYGMTESYAISVSRITADSSIAENSITCAETIHHNGEVKIIDLETLEECPVWRKGEILVRGPQVMKGYLKNPEATAETIDKDGWMHTGDIGHLDEDGRLYVIGRFREMIKYKCLQVPPAELESVILKHPKVADVGVVGIPDPVAGEVPKAFIVKKDSNLTEQEIDDFVKSQVSDYKRLRGGVEFVKSIPKSVNGKIQRKELKKMAGVKIWT